MAGAPISQDLQEFIANHIQSVEQLEILCLLAESPSKLWSANEVFRCVQSTEKSVMKCLLHFEKHQLMATDAEGRVQFFPELSELTHTAGKLVKAYRQRRVAVIETIYKKPLGSVQNVADASRIPKDR